MSHNSVQTALLELALIKKHADEIAKQKAAAEAKVILAMKNAGQKTASVSTVAGDTIKGTLVEGQTTSIDPDRLKKALSAKQWKKVVSESLDKVKLEAAVALGEIDTITVANVTTLKDSKPYVRVTSDAPIADLESAVADAVVSIRDSSGKVKPAARRIVKPKR